MISRRVPGSWRRRTGGPVLIVLVWATACGESVIEPEPPPNRTPVAVGTIPHQMPTAGHEAVGINLIRYFEDPDGDPLTYTAMSTDPSVATAEVSGASLLITAVSDGKATVTAFATDAGGLFAAQSTGVTVTDGNRAPVAVGDVPTRNVSAGTSVTVDVSVYFTDPDGDSLTYRATSNNSAVAAASVTGTDVTITALGEGSADVTVVASDPAGLSAEQGIAVVVIQGEPRFRDDFDAAELSGWSVTRASVEVSEGVARLSNDSSEVPGQLDRGLAPRLTEWETRAMLGRAHGDAVVRVVYATGSAPIPAVALEIGSGVMLQGQDTNFRFMFQDAASGQWSVITAGTSDAVHDDAGDLTEIRTSIKGSQLTISAGDTVLHAESLAGAPPGLQTLTGVGLWVVPIGDAADRIGLFDWIEVSGVVAPGGQP